MGHKILLKMAEVSGQLRGKTPPIPGLAVLVAQVFILENNAPSATFSIPAFEQTWGFWEVHSSLVKSAYLSLAPDLPCSEPEKALPRRSL